MVGDLREAGEDGGPQVIVADELWTWTELGEALMETLEAGRPLDVHLTGRGVRSHEAPVVVAAPEPEEGHVPPLPMTPEHAEAIALLSECLPLTSRPPCPEAELGAACGRVRLGLAGLDDPWPLIRAASGWGTSAPASDHDLWLDAAMSIIRPRRPLPLADELVDSLEALDLDDWLATLLELVRSGPGTPVDATSLRALAARCLDVDSSAVDGTTGPIMEIAFDVVVPVWTALGAVDDSGCLTELGTWGLPHSVARCWGGALDQEATGWPPDPDSDYRAG